MYFFGYGVLEWLEPAQYYAGPWRYHGTTSDNEDGSPYDIVINIKTDELRYTNI